jgi:hypothetical protein
MDPAVLLEARLALLQRVRAVEVALARQEHARAAAALVRGRSHELGNDVQIVRLATMELERRLAGAEAELIADIRSAAESASNALAGLLAAARPEERTAKGPAVASVIQAAVEAARSAIAHSPEVRLDLVETVCTRATAEELEAVVLAALLDASRTASRVQLWARQRQIEKKPWVELLVIADKTSFDDAIGLARAAAQAAGGDASVSDGREGVELAIELPVAS